MLARICSTTQATPLSLNDRILRECAAMCVETAQGMAALVIETLEPGENLGLLPWWCRIHYLHVAGLSLLAAMLGPGLFTESVSRSWRGILSALRAHEPLSAYVTQCVRTFETLSARILMMRYPSGSDGDSNALLGSGLACGHVSRDVGFDVIFFLFGMECGGRAPHSMTF